MGHLLGDLEPAAVLKIRSDARRPEGVAGDLGLDPGRDRPPAHCAGSCDPYAGMVPTSYGFVFGSLLNHLRLTPA
jgi:hypothetical protein